MLGLRLIHGFLGLSAELEGSVDLAAGITGTLDSGKINILTIPIGGIEFPGYGSFKI